MGYGGLAGAGDWVAGSSLPGEVTVCVSRKMLNRGRAQAMMNRLRVWLGAGILTVVAGGVSMWAAPPQLSRGTYERLAAADIAQLQGSIAKCQESAAEARRNLPTARALAMLLVLEAEALGDANLQKQALQIAEVLNKKDFAAAEKLAKSLKANLGTAPLPSQPLHKLNDFHLEEVMSPYRLGRSGGLNIEKDIRDWSKKGVKLDPAAVEILAARTALLSEYTMHMPNDKADVNKANLEQWKKYSQELIDLSRQLAEEAAKGKSANGNAMSSLLSKINNKCTDCHNKFRDD